MNGALLALLLFSTLLLLPVALAVLPLALAVPLLGVAAYWWTGPHKTAATARAVLAAEPLPPPEPEWAGCDCTCDACQAVPPKHGHSVIVEVESGKIILGGPHSAGEMAYAAWRKENHDAWAELSPEAQAYQSAAVWWNIATLHETHRRKRAGDPNWQSWLPPQLPGPPMPPPLPDGDNPLLITILRREVPRRYEAYTSRRAAVWEAQRKEAARVWYVRVAARIEEWDAKWKREEAVTPAPSWTIRPRTAFW